MDYAKAPNRIYSKVEIQDMNQHPFRYICNDPMCLKFIEGQNQTVQICIEAIKRNPIAVKYVSGKFCNMYCKFFMLAINIYPDVLNCVHIDERYISPVLKCDLEQRVYALTCGLD